MSAAFAAAWSVLVLATSRTALGRILATRVSRAASWAAGVTGIVAGIMVSEPLSPHVHGAPLDAVFAFSSSLAALIAAATFSLLARSHSLNLAQVADGSAVHLVRVFRSRMARTRRYWQLLRIAERHGLGPLAMLHLRRRRSQAEVGRAFRDALQESGGIFVKFGQV